MTKSRKKRKKVGRGRRQARPVRSKASATKAAALASSWKLPAIAGTQDPRPAWAYLQQFMVFEMAILNDNLETLEEGAIPHEHRYLLQRWPDAFEFFRHAMWLYAERALHLNPWTTTLRSLMVRARATDPDGFDKLDAAITTGLTRFLSQRNNVLQQIEDDPRTTARERFRVLVKLYAEMYEVDFPLWLVGVLGKAFHTGGLDPDAFGGPTTDVAQGSLIDAVATAAASTPIEPLLTSAYIPRLRNAINHNDYELLFGGASDEALAGVRATTTGEIWAAESVRRAWQSTMDLTNAAMTCCASVGEVVVPSRQQRFADYGVIAIEYAVNESVPYAIVAQLWCFREVDPDGAWLDNAEFVVEPESATVERAGFSSRAWMSGALDRPLRRGGAGQRVDSGDQSPGGTGHGHGLAQVRASGRRYLRDRGRRGRTRCSLPLCDGIAPRQDAR